MFVEVSSCVLACLFCLLQIAYWVKRGSLLELGANIH